MIYKRIINSSFAFLLDSGFTSTYEKLANIGFQWEYVKDSIVIILGYEYIDDDFDVLLQDLAYQQNHNIYVNILDTDIGNAHDRQLLKEAVAAVYLKSQTFRTMPKKHFMTIVNLYAQFVKEHLADILLWQR